MKVKGLKRLPPHATTSDRVRWEYVHAKHSRRQRRNSKRRDRA